MNALSTLVAILATLPHTRITRRGRQVTSGSATVAGEFLVENASLPIYIEVNARGAVREVLAACRPGELVVVTGRITKHQWLNRHGRPGEQWAIIAKEIERVAPGSDGSHALGLEMAS